MIYTWNKFNIKEKNENKIIFTFCIYGGIGDVSERRMFWKNREWDMAGYSRGFIFPLRGYFGNERITLLVTLLDFILPTGMTLPKDVVLLELTSSIVGFTAVFMVLG